MDATETQGMATVVQPKTQPPDSDRIALTDTNKCEKNVPSKECPPVKVMSQDADRRASAGMATTSDSGRRAVAGELSSLMEWQAAAEAGKASDPHPESAYAEQLFSVGDERWQVPGAGEDGVHIFTAQDFPHSIPDRSSKEVQQQIEQLHRALGDLKKMKEGVLPQEFLENPEAFLKEVTDQLPSDETSEFRAGGWHRNYWSWVELLSPYKKARPAVKWLLEVLKNGVKWDMVTPTSQKTMPLFKQKLKRAAKVLTKLVGQKEAWDRLNSKHPQQCHLPNHPSSETFQSELSEKFTEYLAQGVIKEVPEGKRALVGCSLGGVFQNNKVRPVIDPVVTNMYLKYEPVRYESLTDACNYVQKGDWATTTDEKSGYHHMALHPDMWNLLGFTWEGKNYVFTHVPFGVGPACRAYTTVKAELYRIVRELGGVDLTFFIDDMMAVARDEKTALFQLATILRLMGALGFTISKKKLQLPSQRVQFLGLLIDLLQQKFWVPEEKLEKFREMVRDLEQQQMVNNRQLARAAGKLVSFKLAVGIAPLYAQLLFKAFKAGGDWDEMYSSPEEAIRDLKWFAEHVGQWNGQSWLQTRRDVIMAGDYGSNTGCGAFFPNEEMSPIEHSLTEAQIREVQENNLSSTKGELLALLYSLHTVIQVNPELLAGKRLHYQSDNQGTVADVNGMKGCANVLPVVKQIWDLALSNNTDLTLTWHPRETEFQQYADHLSKLPDNSQFSMSNLLFDEVLAGNSIVQAMGGFTIDVFADGDNCKVTAGGKQSFYSRMWCMGTSGVDGFQQDWGWNRKLGRKETCYIYGDFNSMGRILNKVIAEKVDCLIVYPMWPRGWQTNWKKIPVKQVINLSDQARKRGIAALYTAGPRVEQKDRKVAKWTVMAAVVKWSKE